MPPANFRLYRNVESLAEPQVKAFKLYSTATLAYPASSDPFVKVREHDREHARAAAAGDRGVLQGPGAPDGSHFSTDGSSCHTLRWVTTSPERVRCSNKNGAAKWLAKMLYSGIEADSIYYNAAIDPCAKAKGASSAEKWMENMSEAKVSASTVTYNALVNACAKAAHPKALREA